MTFTPLAPTAGTATRHRRLRDLDARMSSFLAEKECRQATSPLVVGNVKGNRMNVRREIAS
ncbi:MAG: hypothetical protein ABJL55_21365 [Roseibium sp.]